MKQNHKQTRRPAQKQTLVDTLDRWIFYGFLAIAIVIPIAMSRITFDQFDIAKIFALRILTLIVLGIWVYKLFVARETEVRWTKLDYVVGAFLALVIISTITSVHIPTAINGKYKRYEGLLTFLNYGILYFLGMQTFTSFKRVSVLSKTLAFTGGFIALYGVMQYIGLDPLPWATLPFEERRSFSTFGNPDLLAGFLVIVLPIALAEFLKAENVRDKIITVLSLFMIFMALLTSFTRGAWIGAAIAVVVFVIISARSIIANPKRLLVVLAAFIGIFAVIAAYSAGTGQNVLNLVERLKSATRITEGSAGTRLEIWEAGWGMIKDHPLFGMGPDTFRLGSEHYETLNYIKLGAGKTVADNAHNWIVQLAAGAGLPATVLLIGFILAVFVVAFRYTLRMEGAERLTYAGLISASVGYFVHLLFGVSISGSTTILFLMLAVLVAASPGVKKVIARTNSSKDTYFKIAAGILSVVALVSAYSGIKMYIADLMYADAMSMSNAASSLASQGNAQESSNAANMAEVSYARAITLYQNGRYYDGYGQFLEKMGVARQSTPLIAHAANVYAQAVQFEPIESDHYIFTAGAQAKLAMNENDPMLDQAIDNLRKSLVIRPFGLASRKLLANIYHFKGMNKEAIQLLTFNVKYDPSDTISILLLAKAYKKIGKEKLALQYYQKVLALQPDNEEAALAVGRKPQ